MKTLFIIRANAKKGLGKCRIIYSATLQPFALCGSYLLNHISDVRENSMVHNLACLKHCTSEFENGCIVLNNQVTTDRAMLIHKGKSDTNSVQ